MPLRIIKTGLTSRKCDRYVKEIKEYISPDGKRKLILMVPDRFSYNAEKLICDELGGTGFNGVSVQTLHQFIRKNASSADKVLLNEGKQMLLRRIINKCIDESSVFYGAKERNGFIESVLEVLEDWKRFCIDLNELESEINSLPDGITRHKLTVLKTVFEAYRKEFDKNKYKDEADLLFDTSAEIRNSAGYSDAIVWIDGFVEFVPAETEIVSAFLSVGADVRIYLPCKPGGNVDTDDVYSVPQRTCYNLCKLCKEHGFQYSVVEEAYECNTNSELSFLCETYDDRDAVFSGEVNSIVLREADDVYEEVENAAREIVKLVSSKNCDFSDISILCGDINGYSSCIEAVFSRYSIPYFSDYKVPLLNHPVSILLTSVFEIVRNKSFPASHMIRYLKTGYIVSDNNDIDYLSLYIAKRGIRGGMWKEDKYFEMLPGGFFDEALGKSGKVNLRSKRLIGMRKIVSEPLYAYYEKTKGKKTVSEHVTAFFDYMNDIKLFDKIHENIQNFESVGENNEAARLAHVWNLLVNLFDQMVAMSGDEKISRATFGEYFKAGIEGSEISIIPAVQNGVSVSDAGHRKGSGVKALIILGATRDTVPAVKREDGLITENELESVKSLPGTVGKAYRNLSKEFELVTAFSETSDFLYISWCSMGAGGEKTIKSPVFELLMAKFPGLGFTNCDTSEFIASPESMLHKLLTRISNNEKLSAYDIAVKEWFLSGDEWKDAFLLLEEAEKYSELVGCISKDVAKELYKNLTQYSVSRLEKYFQCPFMYYLSYGLHLDDGEVYGLKSTDTGNVVHHALAKFCQLVETGAETKEEKRSCWQNITDKKRDELLSKIISEIIEKSGINVSEEPKMQSVFSRILSTVTKASDMIILMMKRGKYDIYANEMEFEDFSVSGASGDVLFHGIIDRLDVFEEDGKTKIRIVDYKTGDKKFNLADALNGIDLQLIVYAMAAEKLIGGNSEISGFFYNSLKKKVASCKNPEEVASEVSKLYKLAGTVVEKMLDNTYEIKTGADMDCELISTQFSSFLPLKLTTKGVYDRYSSVQNPEFMNEIYRNVRNVVSEAAHAVEEGDVRVYPYVTSSKDSCKFCPYASVCMYDHCRGVEINTGQHGRELLNEIKKNNQ